MKALRNIIGTFSSPASSIELPRDGFKIVASECLKHIDERLR